LDFVILHEDLEIALFLKILGLVVFNLGVDVSEFLKQVVLVFVEFVEANDFLLQLLEFVV